MNKIAIIFGGAGYIGTHLLKKLLEDNIFDKYIVADLREIKGFEDYLNSKQLEYLKLDVRSEIDLKIGDIDQNNSWIFNFAAIHREPGHEYKEY